MKNERFVSVILALCLGGLAAATVWNGRVYGEMFADFSDFSLPVTPLTRLAAYLTTSAWPILALLLLAPLILAIATGNLLARWFGLAVVLVFGALNYGLLLPYIALIQGLSGGADDPPSAALSFPLLSPPALILAGNLVVAAAFTLGALRLWRVTNRMESP